VFKLDRAASHERPQNADLEDSTYRVVSGKLGQVSTGGDADEAEYIALMVAVNTGRRAYLQDGTSK
jgi:hypothetical protein